MRKEVDEVNQNPSSASSEAVERMHAIMHLYRSAQQRGLRAGPHDLGHMEIKVLGFFARRPGATQSDLAAHSGRDKAQLTRLIRGLRERGLIEAVADEVDRRSTRLSLSSEGKAMHAALHAHDDVLAEAALAGITDAERATLLALLGRVRANLEARLD
jgi:DNA-binding MarR family transcriptional regulator